MTALCHYLVHFEKMIAKHLDGEDHLKKKFVTVSKLKSVPPTLTLRWKEKQWISGFVSF